MPLQPLKDSEEEGTQQVSWGRSGLRLWVSHEGLSCLLAILKPKNL